jgi:hypothetical protein
VGRVTEGDTYQGSALNGPTKDDIIGVVALIDLYGPTIYSSKKMSAGDRYDWAKNDIEGRVSHPKFR